MCSNCDAHEEVIPACAHTFVGWDAGKGVHFCRMCGADLGIILEIEEALRDPQVVHVL